MIAKLFILYLISFLVAFCSIVYELLLAQAMSLFAGNAAVRYSLVIAIFLLGLAVGSKLADKLINKKKKAILVYLLRVELGLSLIGGASVLILYLTYLISLRLYFNSYFFLCNTIFFIICFIFILIIATLTGFELPFLLYLASLKTKESVYRILVWDYFGILAGSIVFPLVLFPKMQLVNIGLGISLVNLFVAGLIFFHLPQTSLKKRILLEFFSILIIISGAIAFNEKINSYLLEKQYSYVFNEGLFDFTHKQRIEAKRKQSAYQVIDLVRLKYYVNPFTPLLRESYTRRLEYEPDALHNIFFFLNNEYQFWSDFEDIYHEYLAYVPLIATGQQPEKVLVLGGGDGLLLRRLLACQFIKEITLVDIDKEVINWAKNNEYLAKLNNYAFLDPRVKIIVNDAYYFMKHCSEKYDAVYIDLPFPDDYELAKLYSYEFYSFINRSLKNNGFLALDCPGIEQRNGKYKYLIDPDQLWQIIYQSLYKAGFKSIIPYVSNLEKENYKAYDLLNQAIEIDKEAKEKDYQKYKIKKNELIRQLILEHVDDLRQGFILAQKTNSTIIKKYKIIEGVDFWVLNKLRYYNAFKDNFSLPQSDKNKANSIFKPVLMNQDFWWIKIPY